MRHAEPRGRRLEAAAVVEHVEVRVRLLIRLVLSHAVNARRVEEVAEQLEHRIQVRKLHSEGANFLKYVLVKLRRW